MCVSVTSPFIGAFALLKLIVIFLLRFGEWKRKIPIFGVTASTLSNERPVERARYDKSAMIEARMVQICALRLKTEG